MSPVDLTLYKALGVAPDASKREIRMAYLVRAKLHHPDKCDKDDTTAFIAVKNAYEILHDDKKRKQYDRSGICSGDDFEFAARYYSERINIDDIDAFEQQYIGKNEEREDIKSFCMKFKGNVVDFFDFIPFSEPIHFDRYRSIIESLAEEDNHLKPYKSQIRVSLDTLEKKLPAIKKRRKREAKEVASMADELGGMDALVASIQGKQKSRYLAMIDDVESSLADPGNGKAKSMKKSVKSAKSKKRGTK